LKTSRWQLAPHALKKPLEKSNCFRNTFLPLPYFLAISQHLLRLNGSSIDGRRCWYVSLPRKITLPIFGWRKSLTSNSVARIAYIASDVVVSVQPSLAADSEFSAHLRSFVESKAPSLVAKGAAEVWLRAQTVQKAAANTVPRLYQYGTMQTHCYPLSNQ